MQRALTSFYSIEPCQCTDENSESPEQCLPPPAKSQCSSSPWSQPSECSSINLVSWDIAEFACGNQVTKTPIEKLDALIHIYRPTESFCFPVNKFYYGQNQPFRFQWLRDHNWLVCSPSRDGGYCIPCVLFSTDKCSQGQLVNALLTNFARVVTTFSEHAKQLTHLKLVATLAEVKYRFSHSAPSVDQQLSSNASQILLHNKAKLTSIMKTVVFCAKQNIALRGHRYKNGMNLSDSKKIQCNLP